ncbi:MAG: alpha/beta fold hydrolase [Pseudomonadota bacterium]
MSANPTPRVVLLHGLGRSPASMLPLSWRLQRAGFLIRRIGYPSTRLSLADAVAHVRHALTDLAGGPFHLVGHSLGGVIAAALLRQERFTGLHRVVQLGSPNSGSPLAGRALGFGVVRWACGPALADIRALKGPPDAHPDIASVAGTGGWPISGTGLTRPHDGAVTLVSAHAGAAHRAAAPVLHTLMPASARVARLTATFLADGAFPEADRWHPGGA